VSAEKHRFAGYPAAIIYEASDRKKPLKQLLWGDYVRITGPKKGSVYPVYSRGVKGWMDEQELQSNRLLEVAMVDVGQGDGCMIVTPDDKHILVDAGVGDNLHRFLRWRYNKFQRSNLNGLAATPENPFEFEAIVCSHPDADHYAGFALILKEPNIRVRTIYHNGIFERNGPEPMGPIAKVGRQSYLTGLIQSGEDLDEFLSDSGRWKRKKYATMFAEARKSGRVTTFRMIGWDRDEGDCYLPGYEADKSLSIQVLGPVLEKVEGGKALRSFGSASKTKNGHSIVFKLRLGNVSMILGGDLNIPSEELLLEKHVDSELPSENDLVGRQGFIEQARKIFRADIAKSCHHGSADFSSLFLEAVNPIATLVSSGDDEPYAHPRADTLGTIGRFGRGERPLIFSTEISRSGKETITHPFQLRQKFRAAFKALEEAGTDKELEKARRVAHSLVDSNIERSVATYGAIQVRSDGNKVVIAYKIEAPRKKSEGWDIYLLEPDKTTKELRYLSKYIEPQEDDGSNGPSDKKPSAKATAKPRRKSSK
jgi:beta-lactamase superfamily II metal-dependent hydrolase